MQESGEIVELKKKWWSIKPGSDHCNVSRFASGRYFSNNHLFQTKNNKFAPSRLNMNNLMIIFEIFVIGIGFAVVIGILQCLANARKSSQDLEVIKFV